MCQQAGWNSPDILSQTRIASTSSFDEFEVSEAVVRKPPLYSMIIGNDLPYLRLICITRDTSQRTVLWLPTDRLQQRHQLVAATDRLPARAIQMPDDHPSSGKLLILQ